MSREKKLVKNTAILAIGQLSSKVFTFLLLPVYTSMLTPDDYGTIDALQTVISLALYFVTLQIENAVFRFVIDNRANEDEQIGYVTCASVVLVLMAGGTTLVIVVLNSLYTIPHVALVTMVLWIQSLYLLISNLARGLGRNIDYSIASFLVTVSSLGINIVLIVGFKSGAVSILIALVFSNLIGFVYFLYRLRIWKFIRVNTVNSKKIQEMLQYSLPLIPNAISWWIANTSDRLIVIYFLGTAFNGIYAAANKIPTIYTTIFTVFNTAWTESVSLAINDSDRDEYINSMLNNGFKLFSFVNMGIIVCVSLFFRWLIGKQYEEAYNHIFILLVAIFINSMCSLLGGVLGGLKDTKVIGWTTVVGAIANAIINFVLIQSIGLYAASISTLLSYLIIYIFRLKAVKKVVHITISLKYLLQCLVMLFIVSGGYFYRKMNFNITILIILTVWGVLQNRKILFPFMNSIKNKLVQNKKE